MKLLLNRYAEISSQLINFNKSLVTFSTNTKEEDRREVCEQLGVEEKPQSGKYLGLPMRIGRNKTAAF